MNNKLVGKISNEGELKGVIEDNNFNVVVQIMESGAKGLPGNDGYTPIKGRDYFDGEKGDKGDQGEVGPKGDKGDTGSQGGKGDKGDTGEKGIDGKDGYTPQKGVDYYTDADKAEMVSAVLAALPVYEGEVESV